MERAELGSMPSIKRRQLNYRTKKELSEVKAFIYTKAAAVAASNAYSE
jgi:hypothetical protein